MNLAIQKPMGKQKNAKQWLPVKTSQVGSSIEGYPCTPLLMGNTIR
jgi:hypothetical protein